jgi:hypothetical protein
MLILNTGGYQLQALATYVCKEETSGSHCICKYSVSTNKAENKCHSLATSRKCITHHGVSQVSYTYNNAENAVPACPHSLALFLHLNRLQLKSIVPEKPKNEKKISWKFFFDSSYLWEFLYTHTHTHTHASSLNLFHKYKTPGTRSGKHGGNKAPLYVFGTKCPL